MLDEIAISKSVTAFKRCGAGIGCAGLLLLLPLSTHAQPALGVVKDFSAVGGYYDPPHETQMKSKICGAEAEMQSGGRYLLKQLKLEVFRVNGERELVIESPQCVYDSSEHTAHSPARLEVQSGDGRFSVAGQGFLWEQDQGRLTISNQVRSVIQHPVTNSSATAELVITSRWFSFDATNRYAVFHEQVHGDDPQMEFTCGQLSVHAAPGSDSFEVVEATETPVFIGKPDGRRVSADRAIYTRADERVEMTGSVAWQQDRHSGRADRVEIHRLEKDFTADGHVAMKLPRESLGATGGILGKTNSAAARDNPQLLDLFTDHLHSRSNLTVMHGSVRLVDATNQLSCEKLSVYSATGDETNEWATAEGKVLVERGDGSLSADQSVYTKSNGIAVFTGSPMWRQAQLEGQAERVTVHGETGEIRAENQVVVKVPLGTQGASSLALFQEETTNSGPHEVKVFSKEVVAKERQALFVGDVRLHQMPITGSEPRLRSEEMEVKFSAYTNQVESLQARKNVVYEQGLPGITNGPAVYRRLTARTVTARMDPAKGKLSQMVAEGDVHVDQPGNVATSGRATFTTATELLELTDNPGVETPQMTLTGARTLYWDKGKDRFMGTGPFRIQLKPEAVKQTTDKEKIF